MAVKSRATLKAEANTSFADNSAGKITAAILRARMADILDSLLNLSSDTYTAVPGLNDALAAKETTSGAQAKADAALAAAIASATQYATRTSAQISDSTATGRALITALNEVAAKSLLALENATNTADSNKPVSGPQQAALDLKLDKTPTYTDLGTIAGGGTAALLLNRYHKATITGNCTVSFGAQTPVEGDFSIFRFTSTTTVTLTIPSGTRVGEDTPITSLEFPAADHVLIYDRLGEEWKVSDSASTGGVAIHASTHGSGGTDPITIAQSQVTGLTASLSGKSDTGHTHVKANITDFAHTHPIAEISDFPSYSTIADNLGTNLKETIGIAVTDESTAITAGAGKITFRMPFAMSLTAVRASLGTAQASGSIFTVDINEGGVSILSTKLTIDNSEKTSTTAVAAPVISDAGLADDAEITVDVDQVGDGTAKGLKIWLIGKRT